MGAKTLASVVLACLLGALAISLPTVAAPEPALIPKSWEFKFSFDTPRAIAVRNLRGEYEWYWYLTYKVENDTGQERLFVPEIIIATDMGDILEAGKGVRSIVFDDIKKRVGNRLLESPTDVVGRILQGADHAKEGVAIWPALNHNVDHINIFVSGLSGETATIRVPDPADTTKTIEARVSKTFMIDYDLPGNPLSPQEQSVVFKGSRWVMR